MAVGCNHISTASQSAARLQSLMIGSSVQQVSLEIQRSLLKQRALATLKMLQLILILQNSRSSIDALTFHSLQTLLLEGA